MPFRSDEDRKAYGARWRAANPDYNKNYQRARKHTEKEETVTMLGPIEKAQKERDDFRAKPITAELEAKAQKVKVWAEMSEAERDVIRNQSKPPSQIKKLTELPKIITAPENEPDEEEPMETPVAAASKPLTPGTQGFVPLPQRAAEVVPVSFEDLKPTFTAPSKDAKYSAIGLLYCEQLSCKKRLSKHKAELALLLDEVKQDEMSCAEIEKQMQELVEDN